MSNAHQDAGDRYVIIEIPPKASAEEFEKVATGILDFVDEFNDHGPCDWNMFAFVPHAGQEQALRELFGGEGGDDE